MMPVPPLLPLFLVLHWMFSVTFIHLVAVANEFRGNAVHLLAIFIKLSVRF